MAGFNLKKPKTANMKKILMSALFFASITVTSADAQSRFISNNEKVAAPAAHTTKESVNTRTLRRFMEDFPGVTDDVWIKKSTGFVVTFTFKGIQNLTFLSKGGNCESRIQYYSENELPADVRRQVKSTYYDYAITSVKEVTCHNATAYLVTIEYKNNWKVIRVVDEETDVWEDHEKVH